MTGKTAALWALAILCAWDIMRPRGRRTGENPRRRHHIRAFITRRTPDGEWHSFPSYRAFLRYERREAAAFLRWAETEAPDLIESARVRYEQWKASAVSAPTAPSDQPLGTEKQRQADQPQAPGTDPATSATEDRSTTKQFHDSLRSVIDNFI